MHLDEFYTPHPFWVQELEREITRLEGELGLMKVRPSKMSVQDIIGDNDKMLLYTSFPVDVFQVLVGVLKRLAPFNYYVGIPSQLKCKGSMPKSFEDFSSARIAMDATEIVQDAGGKRCRLILLTVGSVNGRVSGCLVWPVL
ncbi:hypothetical protein DPMN_110302 [Dreissena polymorpha]|uniref:Uncharacterized protein n=1 Tax=Dreissena polymorpha TaxID=45954 RepID=A0A9D4QMT0_DREPO|nr:hypothetical protein DPMN_110302 [Dreissena polymorpha]